MKLEKIEDLLQIDTDTLKAPENKRLLTKIKQLLKGDLKQEVKADEIAEDYPYVAISVIEGKFIKLRFDLESRKARVVEVEEDPHGRPFMMSAKAIKEIQVLSKKQKEIN